MGRTRSLSVSFSVCVLYLCISVTYASGENQVGCGDQSDCRRCTNSSEQEGSLCMKCRNLIVVGSRKCVNQCPAGYTEQWSSLVTYMGRICAESSFLGLPVRVSAVVVGAVSGVAFCVVALAGGFLYLRHRRNKSTKHSAASDLTCDDDPDTPERREFAKHIGTLRCEAPLFLAMLNDTRKQVRELRMLHGSADSAVQAFRPVLMDLARILTLLNRPEDLIGAPPPDWRALFAWGERVLRRYKRHNPHQVAQAQLESFLQAPLAPQPVPLDTEEPWPRGHALSTFQPAVSKLPDSSLLTLNNNVSSNTGAMRDSSQSLQQLAVSSLHDASPESRGVWDGLPSWELLPPDHAVLAEWPSTQDCFLDDDFFALGSRPQDEITTEL